MFKKIKFICIVMLMSQVFYCQQLCDYTNHSPNYYISTTVNGKTINADYMIWYKCLPTIDPNYFTIDNKITKALLISEGFDFGAGSNDVVSCYRHIDGDFFKEEDGQPDIPTNQNMLTELRKRGYDIICLNLWDNTYPISYNAQLYSDLMTIIKNQLVANGSKFQITATGWSMGGLVARYALTNMEYNNIDHRADKFVTFDTPHRGANVPLGIEDFGIHAVEQLLGMSEATIQQADALHMNPVKLISENMDAICKDLNIPLQNVITGKTAALQMGAILPYDNSFRHDYQADLLSKGNYPSKCRRIALASGASGVSMPKSSGGFHEAGDVIMKWEPGVCVFQNQPITLPFNLGSFNLSYCPWAINMQVNAMPGDAGNRVFQSDVGMQLAINNNTLNHVNHYDLNTKHDMISTPASDGPALDHVAGGWYPLLGDLADKLNNSSTTIPLDWENTFCITLPSGVMWSNGHLVWQSTTHCATVGFHETIEIPWYQVIGRMTSDYDFKFTFTPTLSTLDISGNQWEQDVDSTVPMYPYPRDRSITPFDAIHTSSENRRHVDFTDDARIFLISELAPVDLYIQNRTFANNYVNRYEARHIILSKDSDPVPNRNLTGDVVFEAGDDLGFTVPPAGEIQIKDGVSINYGSNVSFTSDNIIPFDLATASSSSPYHLARKAAPKPKQKPEKFVMPELNVQQSTTVSGMGKSNQRSAANLSVAPNLNVVAYPNPSKENWTLKVNVPHTDILSIAIYNTNGMLVYEQKDIAISDAGTYIYKISTENMYKGIYLLKVTGISESVSTKIQLID